MAVVVDSGPITATDRASDVPRTDWPTLVSARRMFCAVKLPYDCRELLRFVDEAYEMFGPLGYPSLEDFLRRGLELDPEMVQWALQGLEYLKPAEAIPFQRAVDEGKLLKNGTNRYTSRLCNTKPISASAGRGYILARLERDGHTDLLAQVQRRKLSAHAAALQVGYRKQRTALEHLQHWWRKATADEHRAFLEWVDALPGRQTSRAS